MALIFHDEEFAKKNQKIYMDRKYFTRYEDQVAALRGSKWVYVGNLSFHTSEAQVHALFSRVGLVKSVIMGLNSKTKTPCGFCFVEYHSPQAALESVALISGTVLDTRQIRVELDFGYKNGRHLGRGQSGGQVRDDRLATFDPGRTWASDQAKGQYGPGGGRDGGPGSGRDDLGRDARGAVGAEKDQGEKRGRGRREMDDDDDAEEGRSGGRSPAREDEDATRGSKRRRRADSDEEDDKDNSGDEDDSEGEESGEARPAENENQEVGAPAADAPVGDLGSA